MISFSLSELLNNYPDERRYPNCLTCIIKRPVWLGVEMAVLFGEDLHVNGACTLLRKPYEGETCISA